MVIGNPPYNVGQVNENDNNKNRRYPTIDGRIRETYAKDSSATNKNALFDAYVKFFRWAVDRLGGRDGVICFVSNNSFVNGIAFDGFRKHLAKDFTTIYHLDLGGNARSGNGGNIFGIMVGVGITIALRSSHSVQKLYYYRVPNLLHKSDKLSWLANFRSMSGIDWQEIQPDEKNTWLIEGMHSEFATFLPMGTKDTKLERITDVPAIFKNYGRGVATSRDKWAYDFDRTGLITKIKRFVETYNNEVDRWKRRGDATINIDNFVTYDDTKIKWSRDLKLDLRRNRYAEFSETKIRISLYRPFSKRWLFFDRILNEEVYQHPQYFPTMVTETKNVTICLAGIGDRLGFGCLAANVISNLDLAFEKTQCFPYYTYAEDGSNQRENITDWALTQFRERYNVGVSKWDIFHYVYALLHHPQYRERYADNLKRELPHIPLLKDTATFETCTRIGKQLMELHLNYEQVSEYHLEWIENKEAPVNWYVEKMRLTPSKDTLIVNEWLTLSSIPQDCYQYRLGNHSALEWVIDQYRVSTDARSGITSDPNNNDDPEYIVRLVGRVVTVSIETVRLVKELATVVTQEEWLSEDEQLSILT